MCRSISEFYQLVSDDVHLIKNSGRGHSGRIMTLPFGFSTSSPFPEISDLQTN